MFLIVAPESDIAPPLFFAVLFMNLTFSIVQFGADLLLYALRYIAPPSTLATLFIKVSLINAALPSVNET